MCVKPQQKVKFGFVPLGGQEVVCLSARALHREPKPTRGPTEGARCGSERRERSWSRGVELLLPFMNEAHRQKTPGWDGMREEEWDNLPM